MPTDSPAPKFKQVVATGQAFNLVGILEDGTLVTLTYTGKDQTEQYIIREVTFTDARRTKGNREVVTRVRHSRSSGPANEPRASR